MLTDLIGAAAATQDFSSASREAARARFINRRL